MELGEARETQEWLGKMLSASRFLALGTILLVVAALYWIGWILFSGLVLGVPVFAFLPPYVTLLAVAIHFVAWMRIHEGLRTLGERRFAPIATLERRMRRAFEASLVGFILGLLSLGFLAPREGFAEVILFSIVIGLVPYVPFVYGPVVIAHAVLFRLGAQSLRGRSASRTMALASWLLLGAAATAIVGEAVLLAAARSDAAFWLLLLSLIVVSLTAIAGGYVAVMLAWSQEYRTLRFRPSPTPA